MKNLSALRELKAVLIQKYPDYIDQMIVFGSQVTGTAREYSDYDILLILKKAYNWQFENEIYDTCADLNVKYEIITDVKMISQAELQTLRGKQPFIQNALNQGIKL